MKETDLFEVIEIVRWRRQTLGKVSCNIMLNTIEAGFIGPFKIIGLRNYENYEYFRDGHPQELTLVGIKDKKKRILKLSGFWFEKVKIEKNIEVLKCSFFGSSWC